MTEQRPDLQDESDLLPDAGITDADEPRDDDRSDAVDIHPAAASDAGPAPDPDAGAARRGPDDTTTGDALLGDDADFNRRWDQVQATFVDDPRQAVTDAGALVEDVLSRLSETFATERERAERQEQGGQDTENLRVAMQQYREFFRRLLAA